MHYRVVSTLSKLEFVVLEMLERGTTVYADTETTGLNPRSCKLIAVQLHQQGTEPVIVDWRRIVANPWYREKDVVKALNMLAEKLEWVFHNASFDYQVLAANGVRVKHPGCTKIAEQVIYGLGDEDARKQDKPLTLAALVERRCTYQMSKDARTWFFNLDERPDEWAADFPPEELKYMALDVLFLPRIYAQQIAELKEEGLTRVYRLEMSALPAVCSIEMNGIRVDTDGWRAVIADKEVEARELEGKVLEAFGQAVLAVRNRKFEAYQAEYNRWAKGLEQITKDAKEAWEGSDKKLKWGEFKKTITSGYRNQYPNPGKPRMSQEVNINSPTQLQQALQELGIDIETTGKDALERQVVMHPELRVLLDYRAAQKFVTSFGEKLLEHVEEDGRIHPNYQQLGTSTGRMSCRKP